MESEKDIVGPASINEVKKIKNQVENDVKLLRNRVRMLQQEHHKAQKKIAETAKKTDELTVLRQRNDEKFQRQAEDQERRERQKREGSNWNYEETRQKRKTVQDAKYNMYMQKRRGVQSVREQLKDDMIRKEISQKQEESHKQQQRESIRQMITKSKQSVERYRKGKFDQSKNEQKAKTEYEKRLIYKFEKEAQDLEEAEEQLIKRLQKIQEDERDAFMELEQAMITASLAKKDRLEIVKEVNDEQQSIDQDHSRGL